MCHEKLYKKIVITNPYWFMLMVSSTLKMRNLHDRTTSHHIERNKKMFGRPFSFACISTWENDKILICFSKDAPLKALQKLYWCIPIGKQISVSNLFWLRTISKEVALSCTFFILSMAETINLNQQRFVITIFVELFTAHLLNRNSRFYHLPNPRYRPYKKCCKH